MARPVFTKEEEALLKEEYAKLELIRLREENPNAVDPIPYVNPSEINHALLAKDAARKAVDAEEARQAADKKASAKSKYGKKKG